jgi:hypothetical protein
MHKDLTHELVRKQSMLFRWNIHSNAIVIIGIFVMPYSHILLDRLFDDDDESLAPAPK